MNRKNVNLMLAIMLASAAILNFQAISAGTPEKILKGREVVKEADLARLLNKFISYPPEAIKGDLQGTVKVLAVIEPDGSVSGVRIIEDIGGNCAKEVSRAVRKIHFMPFLENGIPARHALVVSVDFKLSDKE